MGCQQVRPQDTDLLPACGDDALLPETGDVSREIDPVGRKDIRQLLLAQINDWARLCLLSFCQEIEEVAGPLSVKGEYLPVALLVVDAGQGQPGQDIIDRREGLSRSPQAVSLFKGTPSSRNGLKIGFKCRKIICKNVSGCLHGSSPFLDCIFRILS